MIMYALQVYTYVTYINFVNIQLSSGIISGCLHGNQPGFLSNPNILVTEFIMLSRLIAGAVQFLLYKGNVTKV